jgi:hypothetical protein
MSRFFLGGRRHRWHPRSETDCTEGRPLFIRKSLPVDSHQSSVRFASVASFLKIEDSTSTGLVLPVVLGGCQSDPAQTRSGEQKRRTFRRRNGWKGYHPFAYPGCEAPTGVEPGSEKRVNGIVFYVYLCSRILKALHLHFGTDTFWDGSLPFAFLP